MITRVFKADGMLRNEGVSTMNNKTNKTRKSEIESWIGRMRMVKKIGWIRRVWDGSAEGRGGSGKVGETQTKLGRFREDWGSSGRLCGIETTERRARRSVCMISASKQDQQFPQIMFFQKGHQL